MIGAQRTSRDVGPAERVDVAIVGGGPAGAATAAVLAAAGHEVVVLERAKTWRWHACGVFSSPATIAALRTLGLDETTIGRVARPIPAMRLEARGAPPVRLTYGDDGSLRAPAVGFDRSALDPALLRLAASRGVDVRTGTAVVSVEMDDAGASLELTPSASPRAPRTLRARVVVGADGPRSLVARSAGVVRRARLGPRTGLTFDVADPVAEPHDARMVVLGDAYVGLAPVPGGRLNVGIVIGGGRRASLRAIGARAVAAGILAEVGVGFDPCGPIAGAAPLASRVAARAGNSWLLVGDAAGFLDPFTGEGLHRAFVSAELAAGAIDALLHGRTQDLRDYERGMRAQFAAKDVVSLVVQAFLGRQRLLAYAGRRLASRERVRETMGLVIGDLVPASRALDPRFLAAALRP